MCQPIHLHNISPIQGLKKHNFCRNPTGDDKQWCYVGEGSVARDMSRGYCDVPTCSKSFPLCHCLHLSIYYVFISLYYYYMMSSSLYICHCLHLSISVTVFISLYLMSSSLYICHCLHLSISVTVFISLYLMSSSLYI